MRTSEQIMCRCGFEMWDIIPGEISNVVGQELSGIVWFNVWNQIMTPIEDETRENN